MKVQRPFEAFIYVINNNIYNTFRCIPLSIKACNGIKRFVYEVMINKLNNNLHDLNTLWIEAKELSS